MLAGAGAHAQQAPIMIKGQPYTYDPDNAKDVMRICGGCHGELGAGGGGGQYPRLGGLNADYLADQMRKFKSRERENIPMIPFAVDRELSEADVLDVTRFLSEVKLDTKPPPNMPADALAYYEGLFKRLAASAGWKQYIANNYFEDGYLSAAESKKFLEEYEGDIRVQLQATGAKVVR